MNKTKLVKQESVGIIYEIELNSICFPGR